MTSTRQRTYGDRCGVARALDVVGERWALLVVRELLLGPKRFSDLRTGLPRVSPDVLTQRLRELEAADVLRQRTLPPPAASNVYELTPRGRELEPVVLSLGRWGSIAPAVAEDAPLGVDAVVVALRTLFDPLGAQGFRATVELRLGADRFRAVVSDGALDVVRGTADAPDAAIESAPSALARSLWHGGGGAGLRVEGDRRVAERFLELFPLPDRR